METFLLWLFSKFSYFIELSLSWKILGDFSFLHLILGFTFISTLLKLFSFGENNVGSTAEGIGIYNRRIRNNENFKDRNNYIKEFKK